MGYDGISQLASMEDTLWTIEKYLRKGCKVLAMRVLFPGAEKEPKPREHEPVEYEVYVDFESCEEDV